MLPWNWNSNWALGLTSARGPLYCPPSNPKPTNERIRERRGPQTARPCPTTARERRGCVRESERKSTAERADREIPSQSGQTTTFIISTTASNPSSFIQSSPSSCRGPRASNPPLLVLWNRALLVVVVNINRESPSGRKRCFGLLGLYVNSAHLPLDFCGPGDVPFRSTHERRLSRIHCSPVIRRSQDCLDLERHSTAGTCRVEKIQPNATNPSILLPQLPQQHQPSFSQQKPRTCGLETASTAVVVTRAATTLRATWPVPQSLVNRALQHQLITRRENLHLLLQPPCKR
jgi:hypothetical protein